MLLTHLEIEPPGRLLCRHSLRQHVYHYIDKMSIDLHILLSSYLAHQKEELQSNSGETPSYLPLSNVRCWQTQLATANSQLLFDFGWAGAWPLGPQAAKSAGIGGNLRGVRTYAEQAAQGVVRW
jgi:hypothetical protein